MRVRSLGWEDPRKKKWQVTPIFLPGESQAQGSLAGYGPKIVLQRVGQDWSDFTCRKIWLRIYTLEKEWKQMYGFLFFFFFAPSISGLQQVISTKHRGEKLCCSSWKPVSIQPWEARVPDVSRKGFVRSLHQDLLKGNFSFLVLTLNWESGQARPCSSQTLQDKVIRRLQVKPLFSYSTSPVRQSKLNYSTGHTSIDHPLSVYYPGL